MFFTVLAILGIFFGFALVIAGCCLETPEGHHAFMKEKNSHRCTRRPTPHHA